MPLLGKVDIAGHHEALQTFTLHKDGALKLLDVADKCGLDIAFLSEKQD